MTRLPIRATRRAVLTAVLALSLPFASLHAAPS
jgi:hypothetical protein